MNKRKYPLILSIILIVISGYTIYSYLAGRKHKADIPVIEGQIIKRIKEDLNNDGGMEEIIVTKYSPQPFVYVSNLYIKDNGHIVFVQLKGLYKNIELMDLNDDNHKDLALYLLSGKLLSLQAFSYIDDALVELKFKDKDQEVDMWAGEDIVISDLNNDNVFEIIFVDVIQGSRLSERRTIKKFFRWNRGYYEKYNEEETTEDSGFQG